MIAKRVIVMRAQPSKYVVHIIMMNTLDKYWVNHFFFNLHGLLRLLLCIQIVVELMELAHFFACRRASFGKSFEQEKIPPPRKSIGRHSAAHTQFNCINEDDAVITSNYGGWQTSEEVDNNVSIICILLFWINYIILCRRRVHGRKVYIVAFLLPCLSLQHNLMTGPLLIWTLNYLDRRFVKFWDKFLWFSSLLPLLAVSIKHLFSVN